jgi:hypothetical protein
VYPAARKEIEDVKGIYGRIEKVVLKIARRIGFRESILRLAKKGVAIQEKYFHFDASVLNAPK